MAEFFCHEKFSREMFAKFFRHANKEIISFINDGPAAAVDNIRQGLEFARGTTLRDFFRVAARYPGYDDPAKLTSYSKLTAPEIFTLYELMIAASRTDEEIDNYIFDVFRVSTTLQRFYASIQILCEHCNRTARKSLLEKCIGSTFESLDEIRLTQLYGAGSGLYLIYSNDITAIRSIFLANCVSIDNATIHINLRRIWSFANDIGRATFLVSDYELDQDGVVSYTIDIPTSVHLSDRVKSVVTGRVIDRVPLRIDGALASVFSR